MWYEVAPHQRPAPFGSRGWNSCWIWYLSHISRQETQKGFGLVFPPSGERGNGEWDIAVLAEVTPLIRRQTTNFVGSAPFQHLWGQDSHRREKSVSLWAVGHHHYHGGGTRMDDRAMSGHWQRRGTQPWPSSVPPPTSRGEWDLIRPILADTARDKSKSSPISFLGKWSRCKRWRQECTSEGNYASSLLKQTKTSHNNETEYNLNHGWKAKRRSLSKLDKVVSPNSNSFLMNLTAKLGWL